MNVFAQMHRATQSMNAFGKYFVVGCFAFAVQVVILKLLIDVFGCPPIAASAVGFGAASVVNYTLQHFLVFSSEVSIFVTASRYFVVTTVMLGVNSVIFALLNQVIGIGPILAQTATTGGIFVINFFCNRHFTFSSRSPLPSGDGQ